jgi:lipopolysaccharide export system protein LptA
MAQPSPTSRRLIPGLLLPLALLLSSLAFPAGADEKKPATPFQGFSSDNDKPVRIKGDQLESHQDEQKAIFTGNVEATQGESVLHTDELTVFFEAPTPAEKAARAAPSQEAAPSASLPADAAPAGPAQGAPAAPQPAAATAGEGGDGEPPANKVKKLIAKGNVVVTSQDQKATGDDGIFDMEANIVTLTGQDVTLSQGCNVVHGKKLVANTETGLANVSGGTTGRFVSGDQKC